MFKKILFLFLFMGKCFCWFPIDNQIRLILRKNFITQVLEDKVKTKANSDSENFFHNHYHFFYSTTVLSNKNCFKYDLESLVKSQGLEKAIETTSYCFNKMFIYFFFYKLTEIVYLNRDEKFFWKSGSVLLSYKITEIYTLLFVQCFQNKNSRIDYDYNGYIYYDRAIQSLIQLNYFNRDKQFVLSNDINNWLFDIAENIDYLGNAFFQDSIDKNHYSYINQPYIRNKSNENMVDWIESNIKIKKLGNEDFIEIIKNYRTNIADLYKKNKEGGSMDQAMKNINGIIETTANSLWSLIYESPEINQQFMDQWYKENFPTDEETNQDKTKEEKKLKELEKTSYKQQVFNNRRRMNEITDMIVKSGFIIIVIGGIGVACNKKYKFINKLMVLAEEKFSFNTKKGLRKSRNNPSFKKIK